MPADRQSKSANYNEWVKLDPHLSTDGNVLSCQVCEKNINAGKRFHVTQHLQTAIHTANVKRKSSKQLLLKNAFANTSKSGPTKSGFSFELCEALIAANIPFYKLKNKIFRRFLEKFTKQTIPDDSTLRKNYLNSCYESCIENIRTEIGNNFIWTCIDETTDCQGRYIANIIIGKLVTHEAGTPYLLASKQLEKTNHQTVARFFNDSMRILYPNETPEEKTLLLVSDAAPYMVKSAKALQIFYPKLMHLTCLAHALNRVSECIREEFGTVNTLISSTKKVFLKAPLRVAVYKEKLQGIPLPPEPVITRWGTWIGVCNFYATNFTAIKEVVCSFDGSDSAAITKSQEAFKDKKVVQGLMYIKTNFCWLPEKITKLEEIGLTLVESLKIVEEVINLTSKAPGPVGAKIKEKLTHVLQKNPSFEVLREISKIHQGVSHNDLEMAPEQISSLKFAPITSCDVERSFSAYKQILSDRRTNLTVDNLEKLLVTSWYQNKSNNEN